jgi:replicative DNA helicase
MTSDKNFNYLGETFQHQLINQIITDKDFSNAIVDVIEPSYFENKYFKLIIQMIKEFYGKYEHTPTYETLEQVSKSEITQEIALKVVLDTIQNIKNSPFDGHQFVQEKALKFCKQQELQKVMKKAQKILDNGEFENYDTLEGMIQEALQVGNIEKGTEDVFHN